jgi:hypothetical protein
MLLQRKLASARRHAALLGTLLLSYGCDARTPTVPALSLGPRRASVTQESQLGSATLEWNAPRTEIAGIPEFTWAIVRASGRLRATTNPECASQPPDWPCNTNPPFSSFSPEYPDGIGPVQIHTLHSASWDVVGMRAIGGDEGIGLTRREFARTLYATPSVNNPSVQQYGNTGASVYSYIIDGSITVTVTAVASPIRLTESAAEADGTRTFTVEPLYGLQFLNAFGWYPAPPGAVEWYFFPGESQGEEPGDGTFAIWVAECRFQTTCRYRPPGPGRMQAEASVEAQRAAVRTSNDATTPCLDASTATCGSGHPRLNVSCVPSGLVRGDTIRCNSTVTPAQPFTIIRRIAQGRGFTVIDSTQRTYAAGETDIWAGPAIAKTRVTVVARLAGSPDSLVDRAEFEPRPRPWPLYVITNPQVDTVVDTRSMTVPPHDSTALGAFYLSGLDIRSTPVFRATTGPNATLAMLGARPDFLNPRIGLIFLHPALFTPTSTDPLNTAWYNDQNGNPAGTCGQNKMPRLRSEAERHEGATLSSDSHMGIANRSFSSEKPQEDMEAVYIQAAPDSTVQFRAFAKYNEWYTNKYWPAQQAYDAVEYPKIYGTILGCVMDNNPTNP